MYVCVLFAYILCLVSAGLNSNRLFPRDVTPNTRERGNSEPLNFSLNNRQIFIKKKCGCYCRQELVTLIVGPWTIVSVVLLFSCLLWFPHLLHPSSFFLSFPVSLPLRLHFLWLHNFFLLLCVFLHLPLTWVSNFPPLSLQLGNRGEGKVLSVLSNCLHLLIYKHRSMLNPSFPVCNIVDCEGNIWCVEDKKKICSYFLCNMIFLFPKEGLKHNEGV